MSSVRFGVIIIVFITALGANAQSSFESINQTISPHVTGLGGHVVSSTTSIPFIFLENPALLKDSSVNFFSIGYLNHPANVNHSYFGGIVNIPKLGITGITFRRVGYGEIASYDETGLYTGDFDSHESILALSKSWTSGNFRIGSSINWINSNLAGFTASAIMLDIGGAFQHPEKELNIGMSIKNIGFLLNDYSSSSSSNLPLGLKIGGTYKPEFMPFRFTVTVHNLIDRNGYLLENDEFSTIKKITGFLNIGTELVLSENFQILGGYNFMKRYELRLQEGVFGAGWSSGFRFRKSDFSISYGFARQHVAGSIHHLALVINSNRLIGLKRKVNE